MTAIDPAYPAYLTPLTVRASFTASAEMAAASQARKPIQPIVGGDGYVLSRTSHARRASITGEQLKLREIIETMPSMLWSAAPNGEPTYVNQRVLGYAGLRFEDFLNLGWKEFLHPEDFPETERAFYQAIQTGEPYEAVHRLRRADGKYRWHHARGEPLRDKVGVSSSGSGCRSISMMARGRRTSCDPHRRSLRGRPSLNRCPAFSVHCQRN